MFCIKFYKDKDGKSEILELLDDLQAREETCKTARITRNKILVYLQALEKDGTRIGKPFVKHIEGDIWELRPLNNRIFFFFWKKNTFVLLHHFVKKTKKTPERELERARSKHNDYLMREKENEKRD